MEKDRLRESLETLHRELRNIQSVDEASRSILRDLMNDIAEILERPEEAPSERHATLMGRLRESTRHFKASHPEVASVFERAIDTLSSMGI